MGGLNAGEQRWGRIRGMRRVMDGLGGERNAVKDWSLICSSGEDD